MTDTAASSPPAPGTSADVHPAGESAAGGDGSAVPPQSFLRRLFRITPYRVTGFIFMLVLVPMAARLPWSGDIGQHASTIWRLRENLSHPTSPMIDVPGNGSPYFSPYQVFGALVSLATGLVPLKTLHLLAVMNSLLIITGLGAFVRALTPRRWAPVLALFCYFFLWGVDVSVWSGYESWLSFCLGLSYPSAFAAGLMFWIWAGTLRLLGRVPERAPLSDSLAVRVPLHLVLGLGLFVVLLSHPFTGIVICMGMAGIMIGSLRGLALRNWLLWAFSALVVLVAVLAWPYWDLLNQGQSAALDAMHRGLYSHPLNWFGFAVVIGLPALVMRFRRNKLDPLVLTFLLVAAAVGYGWVSGHYSFGRAYPGLIAMLQIATAIEAANVPWKQWFKREYTVLVSVALVFGMWVQAGTVFYLIPKSDFPKGMVDNVQTWNPWPGYQWTAKYLKYGDIVMTTGERPLAQLPAYGYFTVQAGYPDPAVAQSVLDERSHDTWVFFSKEATDDTKWQLIDKYHVGWVIIRPEDGVVPTGPGFQVVTTSPQGEDLIKVTKP
ncbi:hypothetical protein [Kitasatospora viridis]|uniref:4-amino-4-deoxy-L-arabinose transferase-like glycosyltransferase n=1 Tax=Kitasatospora viridis TaxID=281105 RepID=A0A561UJN1_9ACTN|nr:hypothetical protein [Kitasatospora viridis]TWF99545.1 hypothetical protein FHX73_113392 [Kitasatospora viridis]